MRYAALLVLLVACKAPAPACPVAPRVVTVDEIDARAKSCKDKGDDLMSCLEKVKADYSDATIAVSGVLDPMIERVRKVKAHEDENSKASQAALDELDTLKADACACKDEDCANKVEADFETWMKANEDTKGSQAQAEKAGNLAGEIQECIAKALAGGDD